MTPAGVDLCEPPVDQTKGFVTEIDGFDVYLFSGPDDVGYRSPFADRVRVVAWRVDAPLPTTGSLQRILVCIRGAVARWNLLIGDVSLAR